MVIRGFHIDVQISVIFVRISRIDHFLMQRED